MKVNTKKRGKVRAGVGWGWGLGKVSTHKRTEIFRD